MNAPFSRANEAAQISPGKANVPEKPQIIKRNDSSRLQWAGEGVILVQQWHAPCPSGLNSHLTVGLITCQMDFISLPSLKKNTQIWICNLGSKITL